MAWTGAPVAMDVLGHFTVPRANFDPTMLVVPHGSGTVENAAKREWRARSPRASGDPARKRWPRALACHGWKCSRREKGNRLNARTSERRNVATPPRQYVSEGDAGKGQRGDAESAEDSQRKRVRRLRYTPPRVVFRKEFGIV